MLTRSQLENLLKARRKEEPTSERMWRLLKPKKRTRKEASQVPLLNQNQKKGIPKLKRIEIVVLFLHPLGSSSRMGILAPPLPQWEDPLICRKELMRLIEAL